MRPHFFIALIALVMSACASKQNVVGSQQYQDQQEQQEQFSRLENQASRIR